MMSESIHSVPQDMVAKVLIQHIRLLEQPIYLLELLQHVKMVRVNMKIEQMLLKFLKLEFMIKSCKKSLKKKEQKDYLKSVVGIELKKLELITIHKTELLTTASVLQSNN